MSRVYVPESMAHSDEARLSHKVPAAELVGTGAVGVPGQPVVPYLERRRVGEIELTEIKNGLLRNNFAKIARQIPTAAPLIQKPHDGEIMRTRHSIRQASPDFCSA